MMHELLRLDRVLAISVSRQCCNRCCNACFDSALDHSSTFKGRMGLARSGSAIAAGRSFGRQLHLALLGVMNSTRA